jgi:hypothetical protein
LDVFEVDDGRGVRVYRGLAGQVQFTWVSPSRKWVAALSQDWRVGVWDFDTGRLRYAWDVPVGWTADNADLAFDEEAGAVLFVSGRHATRWDLATGAKTGGWSLPLGLNDNLVVRPGRLPLLVRREGRDPTVRGAAVIRWRALGEPGAMKELFSVPAPPNIQAALMDVAGKYLTVVSSESEARNWHLHLYAGDTGKLLPLPDAAPKDRVSGRVNGPGTRLLVYQDVGNRGAAYVYRLPELTLQAVRTEDLAEVDATGSVGLTTGGDHSAHYLTLVQVEDGHPLVRLNLGRTDGPGLKRAMTADGRYVFCGRADGTVCVADVNRCLEQLAPFVGR